MKQFIKLIVLMLIGLALNGCYNAQEKEAIEICKKSCKYPLTFEVIETSSTSYPAIIDTVTFKKCYINLPENMDEIIAESVIIEAEKLLGMDVSRRLTRTSSVLVPDSFKIYGDSIDVRDDYKIEYVNYYDDNFRIDSIHTYTIKSIYPGYERFDVTYSCKNAFGVPCQYFRSFGIIGRYVSDLSNPYDMDYDYFVREDTISVNCFINNSPDKIFKSKDEVIEYLHDFKSNFKLKN